MQLEEKIHTWGYDHVGYLLIGGMKYERGKTFNDFKHLKNYKSHKVSRIELGNATEFKGIKIEYQIDDDPGKIFTSGYHYEISIS